MINSQIPVFGVSDFVAVFNQTLETAYPSVIIAGELANLRISKGQWLYFDLKDENASVKFFGNVRQLPGPLEEGMLLEVRGAPRLHPAFGFSINVQTIAVSGEGSIKKAFALLQQKLTKEGLFDPARKRPIIYPPAKIGLITSVESAAYSDFIKVLGKRWTGLEINLVDVQVQGEAAPAQIIEAIQIFNYLPDPPEVIVITRGGGSADDLAAFSVEQVVRAVASSRIPTLVAVGHERDISLSELAADKRASTPSNAAELLVPDKAAEERALALATNRLHNTVINLTAAARQSLDEQQIRLNQALLRCFESETQRLVATKRVLNTLNPQTILKRGYAVVRSANGQIIKSIHAVKPKQQIAVTFVDGVAQAEVKKV